MPTPQHLRILVVRTLQEFSDDNCSQMAAAISYYVLFSLFPLLIFSVGVVGLALRSTELQDQLIQAVLENFPLDEEEARNDVTETVVGVTGVTSGAFGLTGLIGMAWSGSNMFGVIRRSLNLAYDLEVRRPIVRQKLLDLALVVAFAPFFIASAATTAVVRVAQQASIEIPVFGEAAAGLEPVWIFGSLLVPITFSFAAFFVLYWLVPATKVKPTDVWLGALLAAVLFEAAKVGFGIYVQNFGNYDVVFGSLGAVTAFLFWVFVSANILLFGAEVASEYPRTMRGDYDAKQPVAGGPRLSLRDRIWAFLKGLFTH